MTGTSGTREVGESVAQALTATFTQNDAGAVDSIQIDNRDAGILATGNSSPVSGTQTVDIVEGANTWDADVIYLQGPAKTDRNGDEAPGRIAAGTLEANITINGIYPYFYWVDNVSTDSISAAEFEGAIEAGDATKVLQDASGDVEIDLNTSGFMSFGVAIHEDVAAKTNWRDPSNPLTNSATIGQMGDVITATENLVEITSPDGRWIENYRLYVTNYPTQIGTIIIS